MTETVIFSVIELNIGENNVKKDKLQNKKAC